MLLVIAVCWPLILTGNSLGRGAADDLNYHWPTIQTFAQQLPTPDLSDYQSATTPGYHLELAVVHRLGLSRIFVQLYASFWTIILLGILAYRAGKTFGKPGLILILPLLASMYLLYPGIWLLPDNAAWLGVLVLIILALDHPPSTRTLLISGVVLALLVLIRQAHLWAAATICISAWIGSGDQVPSLTQFLSNHQSRLKRLSIAILATLPAILILVYFFRQWGGLVPPAFQRNHQGPNPATPAFILTQIAILSVFFIPLLWSRFIELIKSHISWVIAALFLGLLIGLIPETAYNYNQGRFSGWWNLANKFPTFADRSPVIILGSTAGGLACVLWGAMIPRRDSRILIISLIAFTIAQTANYASWQRYHEPMLLILGILIFTRAPGVIEFPKRALYGSATLATALATLTIITMLNAQPAQPNPAQSQAQSTTITQFTPHFSKIPRSNRHLTP